MRSLLRWSVVVRGCSLILGLIVGVPAWAHDPGLSAASVTVQERQVEIVVRLATSDARALEPTAGAPAPVIVSWTENGQALTPLSATFSAPDATTAEFSYSYPRGGAAAGTYLCAAFDRLPSGHRQLLTIQQPGQASVSRVLSGTSGGVAIDFAVPAAVSAAPVQPSASFLGFVRMGVEHILTGYDHLLFLCALLLVCAQFRTALAVITCFTAAHSLTLALATFHVVTLSSRVVEPLIAASIVYVGLENCLRPSVLWRRCMLTFAFGLIHGLGFAGALQAVGIGSQGGGVLMPLFAFNLGVELGQLSVAAVVFPILLLLRTRPAFASRGVPAVSVLIAGAGGFWFFQRLLG